MRGRGCHRAIRRPAERRQHVRRVVGALHVQRVIDALRRIDVPWRNAARSWQRRRRKLPSHELVDRGQQQPLVAREVLQSADRRRGNHTIRVVGAKVPLDELPVVFGAALPCVSRRHEGRRGSGRRRGRRTDARSTSRRARSAAPQKAAARSARPDVDDQEGEMFWSLVLEHLEIVASGF